MAQQEVQLLQRGRAMISVTEYFTKSLEFTKNDTTPLSRQLSWPTAAIFTM